MKYEKQETFSNTKLKQRNQFPDLRKKGRELCILYFKHLLTILDNKSTI